jgi:acetyl esterase/lipase
MIATDPLAAIRDPIARVTARWAAGLTLAEIRESFDAFMAEVGVHDVSQLIERDVALAGRPARSFRPVAGWTGPAVLYCHGGGFQIGSCRSHASLMGRLALASGLTVIGFDYRLAPEHRGPAALEDAISVYRALLDAGYPPPSLAGDSAGGALALGVALEARERGWPQPARLALISPWLDLTLSGASYTRLAHLDIFSKTPQLAAMARTYVGRDGNTADPRFSPVFADLSGLPAILVHAGACDITLDDSHLLGRRAREQGTQVRLKIFPGMVHHFQAFTALPQAAASLDEIGTFLQGTD